MVNSELLGFECRVSQPYNLPTPELTRFVNGVEFTNCFGFDAGYFLIGVVAFGPPSAGVPFWGRLPRQQQCLINAVEQPVYFGEPVL